MIIPSYARTVNDVFVDIVQQHLFTNYYPGIETYYDKNTCDVIIYIKDASTYCRQKIKQLIKRILKLNNVKYKYLVTEGYFVISEDIIEQFIALYKLGQIKFEKE